jgi:hypothetical protein
MKLIQFMYSSTLKDSNEIEFTDILANSKRNNLRDAITGMIYHNAGRLVQVLEGPSFIVDRTVSRIVSDRRHYDLNFIGSKSIGKREFSEWDMGYLNITDADIEQSFSRYALFRVASHLLDERTTHGIACDVLRSFSGHITCQP